eukprot:411792-Prymnesium_polylepis.1
MAARADAGRSDSDATEALAGCDLRMVVPLLLQKKYPSPLFYNMVVSIPKMGLVPHGVPNKNVFPGAPQTRRGAKELL